MTFKAILRTAPEYINNMFKFCENSTYNMRSNRYKLALGKPSRNFMKKVSRTGALSPGIIYQMTYLRSKSNFQTVVLKFCLINIFMN